MSEKTSGMSKQEIKQMRKVMVREVYLSQNNNCYDDSKSIAKEEENLPDGREFGYETWAEMGYTFLTYTFSSDGLENLSKEEIVNYLNTQGLKIDSEKIPLSKIELHKSMLHNNKLQLIITCGESYE